MEKRRVFHLELKQTKEHKYYGSLAAIFLDNNDLKISKFSLDRYDFDAAPFENEACIIRKGFLYSTSFFKS